MKDGMVDKNTSEVQELVGQPTYSLVDGVWVPPPGRKLFTPNEFYELFRDESILFLGDSTQRRPADTLHILIENRNNTSGTVPYYLYEWSSNKKHHTRVFGETPNVNQNTRSYNALLPYRGRIDNIFFPVYQNVIGKYHYDFRRNHTIIIAGVGAWDNQKVGHSSNELVSLVNESIYHLHREVPSSVLLFWKTCGWAKGFHWNYQEPDVKNYGSNYQVYLANKVAKEAIESINADNFKLLDWSREILPYSFETRISSGMQAEDTLSGRKDGVPWHMGVKARMLLLQMLAWEVSQREALVLVPISSSTDNTVPDGPTQPSASSYGLEMPFGGGEEISLDVGNGAPNSTPGENELLVFVGGVNASSNSREIPSGENFMGGLSVLFLAFGFFSFAVILLAISSQVSFQSNRCSLGFHDRRLQKISLGFLLPVLLIALACLDTSEISVSTNSSRVKKESSLSCFHKLQRDEYNDVLWETANETAASNNERKRLDLQCPRVSWVHNTHDPSCQVNPFDAHSFLSTFRGRTLLFAGDSLSSMACNDLQDVLSSGGYDASKADSSYGANPFRRGILFGCQEYEYGVLICCSWLAFSNARRERRTANQNLFTRTDGIALNVLEPYDLLLWNTGVHHTSNFDGTIDDMTWLINKTLSDWEESKDLASVPSVWWKESYAQHFRKGHWDGWQDDKRYDTRKYRNVTRQCYDITAYPIENETGIYNQAAEPVVSSFNIPILRVYKASVPLHKQHYKGTDCTHFCVRDRGPMHHDISLLQTLIKLAIDGGKLPSLPERRSEDNKYDIQQRWDLLMEHPAESLMAKMDVCANSKRSTRPPTWKVDEDGPIPPPLKKCLEHSELVHSGG